MQGPGPAGLNQPQQHHTAPTLWKGLGGADRGWDLSLLHVCTACTMQVGEGVHIYDPNAPSPCIISLSFAQRLMKSSCDLRLSHAADTNSRTDHLCSPFPSSD